VDVAEALESSDVETVVRMLFTPYFARFPATALLTAVPAGTVSPGSLGLCGSTTVTSTTMGGWSPIAHAPTRSARGTKAAGLAPAFSGSRSVARVSMHHVYVCSRSPVAHPPTRSGA
jgi:hypothetical protein